MNILQVIKKLPPDQRRVTEQAKCTYSPLSKAFENQGEKQIKAIEENKKTTI